MCILLNVCIATGNLLYCIIVYFICLQSRVHKSMNSCYSIEEWCVTYCVCIFILQGRRDKAQRLLAAEEARRAKSQQDLLSSKGDTNASTQGS